MHFKRLGGLAWAPIVGHSDCSSEPRPRDAGAPDLSVSYADNGKGGDGCNRGEEDKCSGVRRGPPRGGICVRGCVEFDSDQNNAAFGIGLSATPERRDAREDHLLHRAFDGVVYCSSTLGKQPVRSLVEQKVLSVPEFQMIHKVPRYSRFRGPEDKRSLRTLVTDSDRWNAIVDCIANREPGRIVTYALDRQHGRALTRHLRSIGVSAEYLDGETRIDGRIGILERFREGRTRVLVNVALLIEGVDCPAADALVLTYPVRHGAQLQQMVGRVLRGPAFGGTEKCRIWAVEGSQRQLEETLFPARYRYRGWRVKTLSRTDSHLASDT